jgi:hypothetical protein
MDQARILAVLDRRILEAFSRRTIDALRDTLPVRLALPHVERVLALNVAKEAQKDALVIRCSAEALAAGSPPGRETVQRLLDETKKIDRTFLDRIGTFPVGVRIRYEDVAPVRTQRIERLLSELLSLARYPNVFVMVSSAPCFSNEPYPFHDLAPYLRRIHDVYGPRRMLWGADLSRLNGTYKQCLDHFRHELDFLSDDDKEWVLGRALAEALNWPEHH